MILGGESLNKEAIEVQRIYCFYSAVFFGCPEAVNSLQRAEKYAPQDRIKKTIFKSNKSFREYNLEIVPALVKSELSCR